MFKINSKNIGFNRESFAQNKMPNLNLVIKEGYIIKLKSKHKRFFVLYAESTTEPAHLDYFELEKKFKTNPSSYRRSIILRDCFAVIKKNDPRFKKNNFFVFAIYTKEDCFSLMFENQEEMNCWYSLINELHLKILARNKENFIHEYDKIWYTVIRDKKSVINGSFYFCLTSEEIHLYKINSKRLIKPSDNSEDKKEEVVDNINGPTNSPDNMEVFKFPFTIIRSYGHKSNSLLIHLGRSSDFGSCQLWFELKDCDSSKHMHSIVSNTRVDSKKNEDFRMRSNSENNRVINRRNKSEKLNNNHLPSSSSKINNQTSLMTSTSKSSCSLKYNNIKINFCDSKVDNKDSSSENFSSTVSYAPVTNIKTLPNSLPIRSRSTSESSSSYSAMIAHTKNFKILNNLSFKTIASTSNSSSTNLNSQSPKIYSTESIQSIDSNEGGSSEYYMTAPNQRDTTLHSLPTTCIKEEEDYLSVDNTPCLNIENKLKSDNVKKIESLYCEELNFKLESAKKNDLLKIENSLSDNYHAQIQNSAQNQYYSFPKNYVEVPEKFPEKLIENDEDEYIQVDLKGKIEKKLEQQKDVKDFKKLDPIISDSSDSLSNSTSKLFMCSTLNSEFKEENDDDNNEDYIGVDSFSSNTPTKNQDSEYFKINKFSRIPSISCNFNKAKTFSTSSNNTSDNDLNTLGTSPSVNSNYNLYVTSNNNKEEVFKLEKVKSFFYSTDDCGDYIKPARTYSMGSRPQLANHKLKSSYLNSSKSNTASSSVISNNNLILNDSSSISGSNKFINSKNACNQCSINQVSTSQPVQCRHFVSYQNFNDENHIDCKDNRIRAYSIGSHSTIKKDLFKRINNSYQMQNRPNNEYKKQNEKNENQDTNEKCSSTPILINKDFIRNRSSTLNSNMTSYSASSKTSTSSKKTFGENSEDDFVVIDLSKNKPCFDDNFNFSNIENSNKENFEEIYLNLNEKKTETN